MTASSAIPPQLLGQPKAIAILRQEWLTEHPGGSYLLSGPAGVGKRRVALALLQTLFCQQRRDTASSEACGACSACHKMQRRLHPDLMLLTPERGIINIEAVREALAHLKYPPLEAQQRVVLIDEAECLNAFAANAMLKTLEEPPPNALLILLTSNPAALPSTVLSRLKKVRFAPLRTAAHAELWQTPLADTRLLEALGNFGRDEGDPLQEAGAQRRKEAQTLLAILQRLWLKEQPRPAGADAARLTAFSDFSDFLIDDEEVMPRRLALLRTLWRDVACLAQGVEAEMLYVTDAATALQSLAKHLGAVHSLKLLDETERVLRAVAWRHANKKVAAENLLSYMEEMS